MNDEERIRQLSDFIRNETGIELLGPDDIVNNNFNIDLETKNEESKKNNQADDSEVRNQKKQRVTCENADYLIPKDDELTKMRELSIKDIIFLHEKCIINEEVRNKLLNKALSKQGLDFKTIVELRKQGAISESKKNELLLKICKIEKDEVELENEKNEEKKKEIEEFFKSVASIYKIEDALIGVVSKPFGLVISDVVNEISNITGKDVEDLVSHPSLRKVRNKKKALLNQLNNDGLLKLLNSKENNLLTSEENIAAMLNDFTTKFQDIKEKYVFIDIGLTPEMQKLQKEIEKEKEAEKQKEGETRIIATVRAIHDKLKQIFGFQKAEKLTLEETRKKLVETYKKDFEVIVIDLGSPEERIKWNFDSEVNSAILWTFNRINSIRCAIAQSYLDPIESYGNFSTKYKKKYPAFYQNVISLIAARMNVMDKLAGNQFDKFKTRYDKKVLLSEVNVYVKSIESYLKIYPYI